MWLHAVAGERLGDVGCGERDVLDGRDSGLHLDGDERGPWLTVSSGASGSGNGTIGYNVAANPNTTLRSGTITAGGQTFTVTQAAVVCNTTISPTASSPTAGGSGTVAVTANAGSCAWTAASNAAWIITAGASGTGNGSVSATWPPMR